MDKFALCICDSEDDAGLYDWPSEMGSLSAPIAGELSRSEHHVDALIGQPKDISTIAHYENESPQSRHADRLEAMRMATGGVAASRIEPSGIDMSRKRQTAARAKKSSRERPSRSDRSPSPSFAAPSVRTSFVVPSKAALSASVSRRVSSGHAPEQTSFGSTYSSVPLGRQSSMPVRCTSRSLSCENLRVPSSSSSAPMPTPVASLASLAIAARSALGAVVSAAGPASNRVCSPVGRQNSGPPAGASGLRQNSGTFPSSFSTSDLMVAVSPRGSRAPGSPRACSPVGRQISHSIASNIKTDGSAAQFSPFWSSSQTAKSPRAASPVGNQLSLRDGPDHVSSGPFWQSTSFSGAIHGNGLQGSRVAPGSPRAFSPTGRESSFTSRLGIPEPGYLPSRPSEPKIAASGEAPQQSSPLYQIPLASSFVTGMRPGNLRVMGQQFPRTYSGLSEELITNYPALVPGNGPSPFWQPSAKNSTPQAPDTVAKDVAQGALSASWSGGGQLKPPPGLLGELLGAVPQKAGRRREAGPTTVFWKPPPEAAVALED